MLSTVLEYIKLCDAQRLQTWEDDPLVQIFGQPNPLQTWRAPLTSQQVQEHSF